MKEVKGDLIQLALAGEFDVIMHGCNCFNTMGAGMAKQIAEYFPAAYARDKKTINGDVRKLGGFTSVLARKGLQVVNLYTQFTPGPNFNLSALEIALFKWTELNYNIKYRIGVPQIGAGIGGGDWSKILPVINKYLKDYNTTIVYYEPRPDKIQTTGEVVRFVESG